MTDLTLAKGSFAGHETFTFRYMWLRKAVQKLNEIGGDVFGHEDAMVEYGVGKNMVRSIRHWGLATGVIEEDPGLKGNRGRVLQPSKLGEDLFGEHGWDPYLEDPATLWLLHWKLASAPNFATTWYWVFNLAPQLEFTKQQLVTWLTKVIQLNNLKRVSPASLKRDIDCFIRTYVPSRSSKNLRYEDSLDCPLVELGLVAEFDTRGNYRLERGEQPSLPDAVFAYSVMSFICDLDSSARTIPLESVSFAPGSPGRVFCLSEEALLSRLEQLDGQTDGLLHFDDTAGLRQILINGEINPNEVLERHYCRWRTYGHSAQSSQ